MRLLRSVFSIRPIMSLFQLALGMSNMRERAMKIAGGKIHENGFEIVEKAATICGKSF